MSYVTISSQEKQFFTLFMLSRTSDNTTSQNIGGTNVWAVPHLKFWGTVPPVPPRSPPLGPREYFLTCPLVSMVLLVSFSLWNEIVCIIHCFPVAGESGWT